MRKLKLLLTCKSSLKILYILYIIKMSEIETLYKDDLNTMNTLNPQGSKNGRIVLDPQENGTPFFVQDMIPKNEKTNYSMHFVICLILLY